MKEAPGKRSILEKILSGLRKAAKKGLSLPMSRRDKKSIVRKSRPGAKRSKSSFVASHNDKLLSLDPPRPMSVLHGYRDFIRPSTRFMSEIQGLIKRPRKY
jgi:hypothetical protein